MFMLDKPPFVRQPGIPVLGVVEPLCWAAALSSWQAAVPDRTQESIGTLESRFQQLIIPNSRGALDPAKFSSLAAASNVRMAWRFLTGKELVSGSLEGLLFLTGHIYLVIQ